jgi:hypothetical protein
LTCDALGQRGSEGQERAAPVLFLIGDRFADSFSDRLASRLGELPSAAWAAGSGLFSSPSPGLPAGLRAGYSAAFQPGSLPMITLERVCRWRSSSPPVRTFPRTFARILARTIARILARTLGRILTRVLPRSFP